MADSHTENANVRGRTSHAGVVFDARTRRVSGVLCFGLRSAAASSASRALARRDSWEEADARFPSRAAEGRKKNGGASISWRSLTVTLIHLRAPAPLRHICGGLIVCTSRAQLEETLSTFTQPTTWAFMLLSKHTHFSVPSNNLLMTQHLEDKS